MKTKIDFITNSSSQSFMLGVSQPIQAAKKMLEIFFNNWEKVHEEAHLQKGRAMRWAEENPDFEGNIIIPWTSNYVTFIFTGGDWIDKAVGRNVIVDTADSEQWESSGLEIAKYLNSEKMHSQLDTKFLDLTDFKVKTEEQFNIESDERFKEKMRRFREEEKEKEGRESENKN